jgi:hypothetical protein
MTSKSIRGMNWAIGLKEQIFEGGIKEKRRFNIEYKWTLRKLKRLDPNWEQWYDDQPAQTCGEMLPIMKQRVLDLKQTTKRVKVRKSVAEVRPSELEMVKRELFPKLSEVHPVDQAQAIERQIDKTFPYRGVNLDKNGNLLPYSSFPRRTGAVLSTNEAERMFGEDWDQ